MSQPDWTYKNVNQQPLCVMIQSGADAWWNFTATPQGFDPVTAAFDSTKHSLRLTPNPTFKSLQKATIPGAASDDPNAILVEAVAIDPALGKGTPMPLQCYYIGGQGAPLSLARGAVVKFF